MIEEANTNRTGGYDNLDMIEYIVSLIENKVGDLLLAEFFHECRSQNDIMSKPTTSDDQSYFRFERITTRYCH